MAKRLGINLGFPVSAAQREELVRSAQVADDLGVDSVWVAEAWGRDAFTLLTEVALKTRSIKLGTAIVIATHNETLVKRLGHPVLHLDGGLETAGLVLWWIAIVVLAAAVVMTVYSGYEFFRDAFKQRRHHKDRAGV